jgi:hypothetical protein
MKRTFFLLPLLAALLASCNDYTTLTVKVNNTLDIDRLSETIEVPWEAVEEKLGSIDPQRITVVSAKGAVLLSQVLYKGQEAPQSLVFQADVPAQSEASFLVKHSSASATPQASKVTARLVPERHDDFAWENNLVAFRMYGAALMKIDGPSNGIDVWCKRTESLIMDKWYALDLSGQASYHQDHGEGLDGYKVGRTLGCGAMAPYVNDQLTLGNNFVRSKVLDNGPLRASFELTYAPLDVDATSVVEVRRISLDANSHFCCISEMYIGGHDMQVAAGIVLKNNRAPVDVAHADTSFAALLAPDKGYVAYAEKADALSTDTTDNGVIYTAIIFPDGMSDAKLEGMHLLAISTYSASAPFTYYSGAGWSKGGEQHGFATEQAWQKHVEQAAIKFRNPMQLRVK